MRVISLDPGSQKAGFAIIDNDKMQHISSGSIVLESREEIPQRLFQLYSDLKSLIQKYQPEEMAVENIFFAKNAKSSLKLGQARGIVLLLAGEFQLPLYEYSPTQVKLSICGSGRADKTQIEHMCRMLMNFSKDFQFHSSDHADALAICLTHVQTRSSRGFYDRASSRKTAQQKSDFIDS